MASQSVLEHAEQVVHVALGERSYDIHVGPGLIEKAGALAKAAADVSKVLVVTDEEVGPRHLRSVTASLERAGIQVHALTLPAGETTKSFDHLQRVVDRALSVRLERSDAIVALGGGVIGDLAGFAAGIVLRGLKLVQIPTSLLAQVDSSVGGKTGINTSHGKNLVGAFYQPRLVLADTDVLDTLPMRQFRAGYAEIAKYGLIDQPDFFEWLEANAPAILGGGPERIEAIARSCRAKAEVVAADERESGRRALLNLGHTFGHALEAAVAYDGSRLVHGEGVAIGMVQAFRFSAELGHCSPEEGRRVVEHLRSVGLPTELSDVPGGLPSAERLLDYIRQDKKVSGGSLTFILAKGIGRSFIARDVPGDRVRAFLADQLNGF